MHRSALNAEVQHHLKMQEMESNLHQVQGVEVRSSGLFSHIIALLRRARPATASSQQPREEVRPLGATLEHKLEL